MLSIQTTHVKETKIIYKVDRNGCVHMVEAQIKDTTTMCVNRPISKKDLDDFLLDKSSI